MNIFKTAWNSSSFKLRIGSVLAASILFYTSAARTKRQEEQQAKQDSQEIQQDKQAKQDSQKIQQDEQAKQDSQEIQQDKQGNQSNQNNQIAKQAKLPLIDRLGGDYAVEAIINRFIDRLVGDKNLRSYFKGKKINVRKMNNQFCLKKADKIISSQIFLTQDGKQRNRI